MNIYLVERPNGDFSVVAAQTRSEARVLIYPTITDNLKKSYSSLAKETSLIRITLLGKASPEYPTPRIIAESPSWTRSHSFRGEK